MDELNLTRNDVPASALPYVESGPLDVKEFGKWLKALREEKKMTLVMLGESTGYSTPHLSQIETGKKKNMPSPDFLEKLSGPLGVTYSDMLYMAGYSDLAKGVKFREAQEAFAEWDNKDYDIFQLEEQVKFIEHVTDIKSFLKTNFSHTESGSISPVYNGHQLTDQDRQRILDVLKALFPQYQ